MAITITFDRGDPPLTSLTTDGSGSFSTLVVVPEAQSADHSICAHTPNGDICAGFRLQPKVTPSDSPSPQPSPSVAVPSPTAAPSPAVVPSPVADAGASPLAFVTRPPFVFFPLLVVAGLAGWLAYYLWGLRPAPRIEGVTVVHRAAQTREYTPANDSQPIAQPPAEPAATAPGAPEPAAAVEPPPPVEPPQPAPPSSADVPPDLPTPSD